MTTASIPFYKKHPFLYFLLFGVTIPLILCLAMIGLAGLIGGEKAKASMAKDLGLPLGFWMMAQVWMLVSLRSR